MNLSQRDRDTVLGSKLFTGVASEELDGLLAELDARREHFSPGEVLLQEGDQVRDVGLVLEGQGRSLKTGADGEALIISLLERGSFIGVLLAASRERRSPVAVQAQETLDVVFFPAEKLIASPILPNFLDSVAEQSLALNDRISCLIRRSVREKVGTYLTRLAAEKNAREFAIPLDRSAMANYLNVERSALSRELSRMKADGLIDYRKNYFRLLELH